MPHVEDDSANQSVAIILFDGVCNLCNASVNFILDRDQKGIFKFAALQSEPARKLLSDHTIQSSLETVVLIENHRVYTASTAILRIARRLPFPWPVLYPLIAVPRFLRDPIYRFVARHRYRWFGRRESCRMPTPELQDRFL